MMSTATERCPSSSIHMVRTWYCGHGLGKTSEQNPCSLTSFCLLCRQRLLLPLQQALQAWQRRELDKGKRGGWRDSQEKGPRAAAALVEGNPRHHRFLHRRHHLHRPQVLPPPCPRGLREGKTADTACRQCTQQLPRKHVKMLTGHLQLIHWCFYTCKTLLKLKVICDASVKVYGLGEAY